MDFCDSALDCARARISFASSRVRTLRRPGVTVALVDLIGFGRVSSPGGDSQVSPLRRLAENPARKPNSSSISFPLRTPSDIRSNARDMTSTLCTPVDVPRVHLWSLPSLRAWSVFSEGVQYSRLLRWLFVRSRSMWFTNFRSVGTGPTNAASTSRCTLTNFAAPSACNPTQTYPWRLSVISFSTRPRCLCLCSASLRLARTVTTLSNDLTRPKSLTSYSPSYPTTGSHFSSSIFDLSAGLLPSLRLIRKRVTSAFSGIPQVLDGSVQRLKRLVAWPEVGAFPALGRVCRS